MLAWFSYLKIVTAEKSAEEAQTLLFSGNRLANSLRLMLLKLKSFYLYLATSQKKKMQVKNEPSIVHHQWLFFSEKQSYQDSPWYCLKLSSKILSLSVAWTTSTKRHEEISVLTQFPVRQTEETVHLRQKRHEERILVFSLTYGIVC